jgi:hypothetical protein
MVISIHIYLLIVVHRTLTWIYLRPTLSTAAWKEEEEEEEDNNVEVTETKTKTRTETEIIIKGWMVWLQYIHLHIHKAIILKGSTATIISIA